MSTKEKALRKIANSCYQGHDWQPTIIVGYFLCQRCHKIAACRGCVPTPRGNPLLGVCNHHRFLRVSESQSEVLSHA